MALINSPSISNVKVVDGRRYLRTTLLLFGLAFGAFSTTRLILLLYTGLVNVPLRLWPVVFIRGFFFDIATLSYLLPPLLIIDLFLPLPIRRNRWFSVFRLIFLSLGTFLILFLSVLEITFWIEFHTRLNFIALDYLIYTNEVLSNIWQSYPIVWILLGLGVVSVTFAWIFSRFFSMGIAPALSGNVKVIIAVAATGLLLINAKFISIETMYRHGNAFAEELSGNGLFTLAAAARHNELDYEKFYATIPQEKAQKILTRLGVEWTNDLNRRKYDRWGDDRTDSHEKAPFLIRKPRNLILISVESLSAKFLGVYGSKENLTPQLDSLAKLGLMFSNVFATGTRTVRGLEALSLATPPIPGQAIIRRPKNSNLASLGEMLRHQRFEVFFLYGGYAYFDNMSAFFNANDYTVVDRASIPNENVTFKNAWGVADEDLFNHTIRTIDESVANNKPFFAHIMTTSNHRPYTYPPGRIDIPSPGGRRGAVKYSDYAIGQFIETARKRTWFRDTLFVIVADHCASVAGKTELPVADYRIPLIFFGPEIIKPGRIDRMISQIDIPPTLLDLLGMAGDDNFFGKEVMEQVGPARAFISNYQNLGYYKQDQLVVLKPKQKIEGYKVDPQTYESTPMNPDATLVDEAIAYYQTASEAFKKGELELLWK